MACSFLRMTNTTLQPKMTTREAKLCIHHVHPDLTRQLSCTPPSSAALHAPLLPTRPKPRGPIACRISYIATPTTRLASSKRQTTVYSSLQQPSHCFHSLAITRAADHVFLPNERGFQEFRRNIFDLLKHRFTPQHGPFVGPAGQHDQRRPAVSALRRPGYLKRSQHGQGSSSLLTVPSRPTHARLFAANATASGSQSRPNAITIVLC
ncbi:hypothetical protein JB92DRAFT_3068101 [Gautieria morchelliformis]|nr:hypothetical protein JB92DRAFT_3068101 [Gautieria morchelliformis]